MVDIVIDNNSSEMIGLLGVGSRHRSSRACKKEITIPIPMLFKYLPGNGVVVDSLAFENTEEGREA